MVRSKDDLKIPLRRVKVEKMIRQGKSCAYICEKLEISQPTFHRDKTAIREGMKKDLQKYKDKTDEMALDLLNDLKTARHEAWDLFYSNKQVGPLKVVVETVDKQISSLQKMGVIQSTPSEVNLNVSKSGLTKEQLKAMANSLLDLESEKVEDEPE